jgi:hypothetical protein
MMSQVDICGILRICNRKPLISFGVYFGMAVASS